MIRMAATVCPVMRSLCPFPARRMPALLRISYSNPLISKALGFHRRLSVNIAAWRAWDFRTPECRYAPSCHTPRRRPAYSRRSPSSVRHRALPQGNRVERIRAGVVHHQMAVHVVKRIAQHHAGETDGVYADIQQRPSGQRRIELRASRAVGSHTVPSPRGFRRSARFGGCPRSAGTAE